MLQLISLIFLALLTSWTRLLVALSISTAISIIVGIIAARNAAAEKIIIPIVDLLQSIPVLGFFPIAILVLIHLIPGYGVETASIFLIMTSQIWNIIFAVYEAVKGVPWNLEEAARLFRMNTLSKIFKLYIPASIPRIAGNLIPSFSNGLFFLTSCELISLGRREYRLFGISTVIMDFVSRGMSDLALFSLALVVLAVILTYIGILKPLLDYSEKFRYEEVGFVPRKRTGITRISEVLEKTIGKGFSIPVPKGIKEAPRSFEYRFPRIGRKHLRDILRYFSLTLVTILCIYIVISLVPVILHIIETIRKPGIAGLISYSLAKSFLRVILAILIGLSWTLPVGIFSAFHEKIGNIAILVLNVIASIPAPLFIPFLVSYLEKISVEVLAIIIMVINTQWYILFNIHSSVSQVPRELREVVALYRIRGVNKWRIFYIPASMKGLITGLVTAIGGTWNALIIAEAINIEGKLVSVDLGIGKLMVVASIKGDLGLLYLSTLTMALFVVAINRLIWQRVYDYVSERYGYGV